jgi:GTP cyclohydrolase IA
MNYLKKANGNIPRSSAERQNIIENAAAAYAKYMNALGIDFTSDPHSADTPMRVAKAFVNDIAKGCYMDPPNITAFENTDNYDGMVCQNDIKVVSLCSHHHLPFTGKAHVAYIPSADGKVIGLSKLNRIVDWFSRRPQVQENLTMQIHEYVNDVCENNIGVAVMLEANHTCCSNRGIGHESTMRTAKMTGAFSHNGNLARSEFYKFAEFSQ